jgi:hypothetical protein
VEGEADRFPIPMIRIAITAEAYEAIARTLALGTVACEPQPNENGERVIWIEERWLDKLNSIRRSGELLGGHHQAGRAVGRTLDTQATLRKHRRSGESYSNAILRLAEIEASHLGPRRGRLGPQR